MKSNPILRVLHLVALMPVLTTCLLPFLEPESLNAKAIAEEGASGWVVLVLMFFCSLLGALDFLFNVCMSRRVFPFLAKYRPLGMLAIAFLMLTNSVIVYFHTDGSFLVIRFLEQAWLPVFVAITLWREDSPAVDAVARKASVF